MNEIDDVSQNGRHCGKLTGQACAADARNAMSSSTPPSAKYGDTEL